MKSLIMVLFVLMLAGEVGAGESNYVLPPSEQVPIQNITNVSGSSVEAKSKGELGVKAEVDMPNLVRFTNDWTLGASVGKELMNTNAGDGWYVVGKVTYTGSLINFSN